FQPEQEVERIVYPAFFELLEQLLVMARVILNLVHRQQAVLADRFHPDIDVEDSRLGRQVQQLIVMIRVDRPQAREADVERLERLEQLARELVLAGDLIVDELKALEAGSLDDLLYLLDDVLDRPRPIRAVVEDRNLAERASIRASTACLHRHRLEQVAIELEQLVARARQVLQIVQLVGLVNVLELAVAPILQKFGPHQVGLALHYRVAMLERLFGLQRRMESAEHDRDATLAELVAELVRAQRRADRRRHADQVPSTVEIDLFETLVA